MNRLFITCILCSFMIFAACCTYAAECDNPRSSEDVAYCLGKELRDSDSKINQTYQALISKISIDEQKRLRHDQRIWIKERDDVCNCASRERDREKWYQGLLKDYRKTVCVTRYTRQRTAELDRMMTEISSKLPDNDVSPVPVPPPSRIRRQVQADYQLWATSTKTNGLWYFEVTVDPGAIAGFSPSALWMGCVDKRSRNTYGTLAQIRGSDTNLSVFRMGYALDLTSGKLYIRKDGVWSKGSPGSSGGLDLKLGSIYGCGMETTVLIAPLIDKGFLQHNFGEKPFIYAIPDGYKPLTEIRK